MGRERGRPWDEWSSQYNGGWFCRFAKDVPGDGEIWQFWCKVEENRSRSLLDRVGCEVSKMKQEQS
jgi:hypothetical protein